MLGKLIKKPKKARLNGWGNRNVNDKHKSVLSEMYDLVVDSLNNFCVSKMKSAQNLIERRGGGGGDQEVVKLLYIANK